MLTDVADRVDNSPECRRGISAKGLIPEVSSGGTSTSTMNKLAIIDEIGDPTGASSYCLYLPSVNNMCSWQTVDDMFFEIVLLITACA